MKKTLNRREYEKLSAILGIEKRVMEILSDNKVLDASACRSVLVRGDYKRILSEGKYGNSHIIGALAKEYGISRSSVELIIYNKEINKTLACTGCGKPVSKYKFARYGGLCDGCLVAQVKIN